MLGKTEGKRRRVWQRMRWLDSTTDSMDMNLSKLQEMVEDRGAWCATVHGVTKNRISLKLLSMHALSYRLPPPILREINPGYSLEELMLKLKHQHFGHLMRRADSLEKTLMLGKIEGRRRRG